MKVAVHYPVPPSKVYESDDGEVWIGDAHHMASYDSLVIMNRYYAPPPRKGDALLILEPPIVDAEPYRSLCLEFERYYTFMPIANSRVTIHQFRAGVPPLWPELSGLNRTPWEKRLNRCIAVMGNKYIHRLTALEGLSLKLEAQGIGLDVYGRPGFDAPWYRGPIGGGAENKRKFLSKYRYCYCSENQRIPRYMTEKLPEAVLAGCFPIYQGASPSEYPCIPWRFVREYADLNETADSHERYLREIEMCASQIRTDMSTNRLWQLILTQEVEAVK